MPVPLRIWLFVGLYAGLSVACTTTSVSKAPVAVASPCLRAAKNQLEKLKLPTSFIERELVLHPEHWRSDQQSALRHLGCGPTIPSTFKAMDLANFYDEVVGDFPPPSCIYSPYEERALCLALDANLPGSEQRGWQAVQLFTHLHSTTVQIQLLTAAALYEGRALQGEDAAERARINFASEALPDALAKLLRYLETARKHDVNQYQRNFGRGTGNWQTIEWLLHTAEKTYLKWRELHRGPNNEAAERALWTEYRELRRRLYLLN